MNGYQWTDAGAPQGRERLKTLLDSGVEVFVNTKTGFGGKPWRAIMFNQFWNIPPKGRESYHLVGRLTSYDCKGDFESLVDRFGVSFLDPSPRLEPSELKWESREGGTEIAHNALFCYVVTRDGSWHIESDIPRHKPAASGSVTTTKNPKKAAKAAIHEWRANHLKSILG